MKKKATIKDVAQSAGVSVATVSRVVNGLGGYSENTRRLIEQTMDQMGYQPNIAARTLKTNQSNLLGFVLPAAATTSLERILYAFEREAELAGYQVVVCRAESDSKEIEKRVRVLSRLQVDGIAFCSHQPGEAFDQAVSGTHTPCVLISNRSVTGRISSIRTDDFGGAYAAASYLLEKGHRRFALLVGPKEDTTAGLSRLNGYRQALLDRGIHPEEDMIFYGAFGYKETMGAAKRLLQHRDRFTAVLAAADDMATAVLTQSYHLRLHVPDDFSIIGYDNVLTAEMAIPPLTTVAQPFEELGSHAVQILLDQIKKNAGVVSCVLPVRIIERDTVRALSPAAESRE